jgi:hypothetical protein
MKTEVKLQHCHPEPSPDGNKENVEVKLRTIIDCELKSSGAGQEESIYKTLGWDDDIDELA